MLKEQRGIVVLNVYSILQPRVRLELQFYLQNEITNVVNFVYTRIEMYHTFYARVFIVQEGFKLLEQALSLIFVVHF